MSDCCVGGLAGRNCVSRASQRRRDGRSRKSRLVEAIDCRCMSWPRSSLRCTGIFRYGSCSRAKAWIDCAIDVTRRLSNGWSRDSRLTAGRSPPRCRSTRSASEARSTYSLSIHDRGPSWSSRSSRSFRTSAVCSRRSIGRCVLPRRSPDSAGWRPARVARLLVLPDASTARRRVADHASTFANAFPTRGAGVQAWLRSPTTALSGLIFLSNERETGTEIASATNEDGRGSSSTHGARVIVRHRAATPTI